MSKLATLKMFEKMDADEHFKTAKKIASDNMASPNYTCSTLLEDEHDHSIKSYIIDLLIKENESTFWSCKLAIIEKEQKQQKVFNLKNVSSEENLKLDNRMKEFYKFFKYNGKIIDIKDFEIKYLDIFSRKVLEMIKQKDQNWELNLPKKIPGIIKKNKMFGFK